VSLLSVTDLSIDYSQSGGTTRAVSSASFSIGAGSAIGLVGESGSGKTTLALSLLGLLPANGEVSTGEIEYEDERVSQFSESQWRRLRWTRAALVFQGGMNALNPVRRILDQIVEPMLIHETESSKQAATQRAIELLSRVGIPSSRARDYPHEYSGGMRQRAGIAMALACRPQLLIADEPATAIDVVVQAQIIRLLAELREGLGLALLIITHDLGVVAQLCDDVIVMYASEIVESASVRGIFHSPKHPYTKQLLESVPRFTGRRGVGAGISGQPPSLTNPPTGCRFHPRCPSVFSPCAAEHPPTTRLAGEHLVACHLYDPHD
jgi:peptide/nickel transport system ATP-binding protein